MRHTAAVSSSPVAGGSGGPAFTSSYSPRVTESTDMSPNDIAFARLPHVALVASSMPDLQRKARWTHLFCSRQTDIYQAIVCRSLCTVRRAKLSEKSRSQGGASLLLHELFQVKSTVGVLFNCGV